MKKYAVIGGDVTNSLSPDFHREFGKATGIELVYIWHGKVIE